MAKKETVVEAEEIDSTLVLDGDMMPAIDAEAIAPQTSTAVAAPVSWEDELAQYAVEAAEEEALGGTFLSTKNGRLNINGNPVGGNALASIIIASTMENAFYPGKYDPNNPAPPACYSFGDDEDTMVPHKDVKNPVSPACAGCPNNEWDSGTDGKGKACKNVRRLALLPADCINNPAKIMGTEQIYLKIPVTSVKDWGKYVHGVSTEFKRPPFAVITEISAVPDDKTQFKVTFKCKGPIAVGEATAKLIECHKVSKETIKFPYPAMTEPAAGTPAAKNAKF